MPVPMPPLVVRVGEENCCTTGGDRSGSPGMKGPSSLSLSNVIIEPSANETRNRDGEPGTQRTCVHGDLQIQP